MKNFISCIHCGSRKHQENDCSIAMKADLLRKGVSVEQLFPYKVAGSRRKKN